MRLMRKPRKHGDRGENGKRDYRAIAAEVLRPPSGGFELSASHGIEGIRPGPAVSNAQSMTADDEHSLCSEPRVFVRSR
jgi:hypothetical protein